MQKLWEQSGRWVARDTAARTATAPQRQDDQGGAVETGRDVRSGRPRGRNQWWQRLSVDDIPLLGEWHCG